MRISIYCRVSTGEQTTENQRRDLLRFCESRQWEVVKTFEDVGISGAKHDRPALVELMEFVRKGGCQAVLVWRFDRFARSTSHLLEALHEFQSLGVDFISYSEGVDTSTAAGNSEQPSPTPVLRMADQRKVESCEVMHQIADAPHGILYASLVLQA